MANLITETDIEARRFVTRSSRYIDSEVIYYGENRILTFTTYKKPQNRKSEQDKFYVITPGTEYRPDLVSKKAFGTVDFWWKILEFNNMKDIFEFKSGKNIRIPINVLG